MLFNVWHIANNGDVYPVITAIEESEACKIADLLQDMSFAGLLPETFYVTVPIGADIDWIERMSLNSGPAVVDYMQEYYKYLACPVPIRRYDYGRS
jgi:hypothetical protein